MRLIPELEYVSVAETKSKLSEKIRNIINRGRKYAITSHGKPKVVLIGYQEYIALAEGVKTKPRKISLEKWKSDASKRGEVINSVSSLFDKSTLSRKGQKEYKKNEVKKMGKIKK